MFDSRTEWKITHKDANFNLKEWKTTRKRVVPHNMARQRVPFHSFTNKRVTRHMNNPSVCFVKSAAVPVQQISFNGITFVSQTLGIQGELVYVFGSFHYKQHQSSHEEAHYDWILFITQHKDNLQCHISKSRLYMRGERSTGDLRLGWKTKTNRLTPP